MLIDPSPLQASYVLKTVIEQLINVKKRGAKYNRNKLEQNV